MDMQAKLLLEKDFSPKGPIFEVKPGWGGKLKNWIKANYKRFLTVMLIGFIVATGITLAIKQKNSSKPEAETASTLTQIVAKGDSKTLVARKVLAEYLSQFTTVSLSNGQKVFIEELLKKEAPEKMTEGEKIEFKVQTIKTLIDQSFKLLPSTLDKWEMYARNVKF
jgi:hypothetical protein